MNKGRPLKYKATIDDIIAFKKEMRKRPDVYVEPARMPDPETVREKIDKLNTHFRQIAHGVQ